MVLFKITLFPYIWRNEYFRGRGSFQLWVDATVLFQPTVANASKPHLIADQVWIDREKMN